MSGHHINTILLLWSLQPLEVANRCPLMVCLFFAAWPSLRIPWISAIGISGHQKYMRRFLSFRRKVLLPLRSGWLSNGGKLRGGQLQGYFLLRIFRVNSFCRGEVLCFWAKGPNCSAIRTCCVAKCKSIDMYATKLIVLRKCTLGSYSFCHLTLWQRVLNEQVSFRL